MLDSLYHYDIQITLKSHFWCKNVKILTVYTQSFFKCTMYGIAKRFHYDVNVTNGTEPLYPERSTLGRDLALLDETKYTLPWSC